MSEQKPAVEVIQGDVLEFPADVLALKYAQHYYGADEVVASLLTTGGAASANQLQPPVWECAFLPSKGLLPSRYVLFVGVPRLLQFNYNEIEKFAFETLKAAAQQCPDAKRIALTLHGPGYGLDEVEALQSELRGIFGAITGGHAPAALQQVTILERNAGRVERLQSTLKQAQDLWNTGAAPTRVNRTGVVAAAPPAPAYPVAFPPPASPPPAPAAKETPAGKPKAFVAMPFATEMEDVYFYGIQNPVRRLGFICERIDQEAFTGDVLPQMRARIESAEIVIADLTGANPNVYLEVGYAWGKARPTVLLIKEANELRFDVRGQRCLTYKSIKDLENKLISELQQLTGRQAQD